MQPGGSWCSWTSTSSVHWREDSILGKKWYRVGLTENSLTMNFRWNSLDQQIRGKNYFATEDRKVKVLLPHLQKWAQRVTQVTQESKAGSCTVFKEVFFSLHKQQSGDLKYWLSANWESQAQMSNNPETCLVANGTERSNGWMAAHISTLE